MKEKQNRDRRARFIFWAPCWGRAIIGVAQWPHVCIIHATVSVAETKAERLGECSELHRVGKNVVSNGVQWMPHGCRVGEGSGVGVEQAIMLSHMPGKDTSLLSALAI